MASRVISDVCHTTAEREPQGPQTATGHDGRILGDVYVEIGPQDADYSRLAATR